MLAWVETWQKRRKVRQDAREFARILREQPEFLAAAKLSPPPEPKVKSKQQAVPSYLRSAKPNTDSPLPRADRALANLDLTTYRSGANTRIIVRDFAASSPDMSASVFAYIRTAITDSYVAVARNLDGSFNAEGTALAQAMLARFDVLQDYSDGFSGINSMRSNSEMLGKELMFYGACSGELVLGKDRLPRTIQPISVTEVDFYPDKSGKFLAPKQRKSGLLIDLDIPTFFYTSLDQDLLEPYATSPLEPAIQPVLTATEFMNDLRRVVKRVVQPRMTMRIDEGKMREFCAPDVLQDQEKLTAHMNSIISQMESKINGLAPEDALVFFDTVSVDLLNNGNITLNKEWEVLTAIMDSKLATGVKALPSILGHGSGSQNIASTETMLFMKSATGAVQLKLNELYSRMLTLAVRLFGIDVTVDFKYAPIDLRPEAELEAFKQMKQERVLAQLSLGFISNDEASLQLTGKLAPLGMEDLSGTGFHQKSSAAPGNPYSNTSTGPGGGALNQGLKPGTPKQPKGPPLQQVK